MMKQTWEKPQLTVLVRGHIEENVLKQCKNPQDGGGADYSPSNATCDAALHCEKGNNS